MFASGLRLEEAAKLRPCDIQQLDGIWFIDVNEESGRLKTRHSRRRVPIHSALLDSLLRRKAQVEAQSGPQANLWGLEGPDSRGRWSEQLSKRLNTRVDRAGITEKKLVMESARNTFIHQMREAGVDEPTVADLVGHSSGDTMSFSRYADRASLGRLSLAVEKLKFANSIG
jgi:integrase